MEKATQKQILDTNALADLIISRMEKLLEKHSNDIIDLRIGQMNIYHKVIEAFKAEMKEHENQSRAHCTKCHEGLETKIETKTPKWVFLYSVSTSVTLSIAIIGGAIGIIGKTLNIW